MEHAEELRIDPNRVVIVGDSVGVNVAAVLTLMAKERRGPHIRFQVLFYPVTDYRTNNASYRKFAEGPWLTARTMQWMFDLQGYKGYEGSAAFPLRATIDQLSGQPDAPIITDDDILQEEGAAYAAKLGRAGVRVTPVRYNQTVHDVVMLNPLADTPAVRGAVGRFAVSRR